MLNPFEYFFLISNVYILLIFFFYFYKNRHWFLRTYIIGKTIQLAGILLFEFSKSMPGSIFTDIAGILFIVCLPFEIFGIISYNGRFDKKTFKIFFYATIILCILDLIGRPLHLRINIYDLSTVLFYCYGGIVLLRLKDKSRFRYLIGINLLLYSFLATILIISITQMAFHPDEVFIPGNMPRFNNIRETYNNLIYFIMLVTSIGYLVILKEQDEFALDLANEQINKENLMLKKLDEDKNKFFSIIAHDLKGPIGTLTNLTELLIESKENHREKEYDKWLNLINQTATRTNTLLNNLLQWGRSESGALVTHPETIDLKHLINEVIRLMQPFAQGKDIHLMNNCPDNCIIFADKEMIRFVIRNLISNAIKFTKENGNICLHATSDKETILTITDTGIGMSSKVIGNLFAFDSTYSTRGTNNEEGSGLGLKLTSEFVTKNSGRIWAESTPGVGTTFYVSLPGA
jgi:signal transduction histidine kinase